MNAVASPHSPPPTLVLTRGDVATLMSAADWLDAVEASFRAHAYDRAELPMPMHIAAGDGAFHAKGARSTAGRSVVAVKLNANFPANPHRHRLPTIQGVAVLFDASNGCVLAVIDSAELTLRRTAAATALAARLLAPAGVESMTLCGCGAQGRAHLEALVAVISPRCAYVWDLDTARAKQFAREMTSVLKLDVVAVAELKSATRSSQVIVTTTTARQSFLGRDMVSKGAFVAAVGADSPEKSELTPDLMVHATIVVDLLAQAAVMGDLHHAIEAGRLTVADVHAELADVIVGRKPGRTRADEVIVFDSTGTALQDVAGAARIYERAVRAGIGTQVTLNA